jgi:hypothetical protein
VDEDHQFRRTTLGDPHARIGDFLKQLLLIHVRTAGSDVLSLLPTSVVPKVWS